MTKRPKRPTAFAVCIDNTGYPASLEAGKLYRVVPDTEAEKHGLLRVIDESGEDYGYSAERFFVMALPSALEKVLKAISDARQPNPTLKPTSGANAAKAKRSGTRRRSRLSVEPLCRRASGGILPRKGKLILGKRTQLTAITFALWISMIDQSIAAGSWRCNAQPVEPCFAHHGRLSSQNGTAFAIWLIGTTRRVGVYKTEMPSFAEKYLEITSMDHSYIYGDFKICPLAPDKPGHMRPVCVMDAEKLVVENLRRSQPAFRLLNTWPKRQRE